MAMHHVDELVHLSRMDLLKASWIAADADGHAAEARIAPLADDE